mmetsp:Transcript_25628/g.38950  ORF Transcript_25628/g.38950 Transcript_25628/m.38950 type:complete len:114 (+) Transcript_25628:117-458(+)
MPSKRGGALRAACHAASLACWGLDATHALLKSLPGCQADTLQAKERSGTHIVWLGYEDHAMRSAPSGYPVADSGTTNMMGRRSRCPPTPPSDFVMVLAPAAPPSADSPKQLAL